MVINKKYSSSVRCQLSVQKGLPVKLPTRQAGETKPHSPLFRNNHLLDMFDNIFEVFLTSFEQRHNEKEMWITLV